MALVSDALTKSSVDSLREIGVAIPVAAMSTSDARRGVIYKG